MGNSESSRYENARKTGSLQLSKLNLSKVPESVKKLTTLRVLDLSHNSITYLDSWIGSLIGLKSLNISGNKLETILKYLGGIFRFNQLRHPLFSVLRSTEQLPADLSQLTKLETINASNNRISTIFPSPSVSLERMRHLRIVNFSNNNLTQFPLELCTKEIPLDLLDLSKNNISLVPDCASLLQVIELNLSENRISVLSEAIAKCPRLKVLRLTHNRLQLEDFPLAILEDSNISLLFVDGNPLSIKALQEVPAYTKYMERYTATKRKAVP